jgi:leucyl-tRNA synthetase
MITPEHDKAGVEAFLEGYRSRAAEQKTAGQKTLHGTWTGASAIHPITGDLLPIWIADYVLKDYGTGAIMAVPGDDERDRNFALHQGLPILEIIDRPGAASSAIEDRTGTLMNSHFSDGRTVEDAIAYHVDLPRKTWIGSKASRI